MRYEVCLLFFKAAPSYPAERVVLCCSEVECFYSFWFRDVQHRNGSMCCILYTTLSEPAKPHQVRL